MAHLLSLSRRGRFVLRAPNGRLADLVAHHSQHAPLVQIGIGELRRPHEIPANLEMPTGALGPPSLFGAGEYAQDGLLATRSGS